MSAKKSEQKISFEQAIEELETMVDTMESGQLPLEQLITNYERGATLVQHCETVLNDARERLELITINTEEKSSPSVSSAKKNTLASEKPTNKTSTDHNDDEIRLF